MATSFAAIYLRWNRVVEVTSHAILSRRRPYGGEEDILAEVEWPEIQQGGKQEREECDAPSQEWHAPAGEVGPRRQGEEPQAGDRHRAVGGPEEGREGPEEEELQREEEAVEGQVLSKPGLGTLALHLMREAHSPAAVQRCLVVAGVVGALAGLAVAPVAVGVPIRGLRLRKARSTR
jgi:hypothetical protein